VGVLVGAGAEVVAVGLAWGAVVVVGVASSTQVMMNSVTAARVIIVSRWRRPTEIKGKFTEQSF
jgi:hypothetical protein